MGIFEGGQERRTISLQACPDERLTHVQVQDQKPASVYLP